MKLRYLWSSAREPFAGGPNNGIEAVPGLLEQLRASDDVEFVDTSNLSEEERSEWYGYAIVPAVWRHYEVKRVLGTNRHSACWFGAEVPALLVTDADPVGDTYPHRKGNRITTIHDFLTDLFAARAESTLSGSDIANR
jgi:hypothetical protein